MNPVAKRPLEFVAFFTFEVRIQTGSAYVFLAVDAYLDFVFNLGVERDKNPETILKNIYFLIDHPDFAKHLGQGFTLVLEEFQELAPRIEAIIKPEQGNVIFNKGYNNLLSNPVLLSIRNSMHKER